MATQLTTQDKRDVVESVSKDELLVKAQQKLGCKSLDVEVPANLTLIETMEGSLNAVKTAATAVDPEQYKQQIVESEQQIATLKTDAIKATFVPLKAMELLLVQGWVTEAALKGQEMGFELDVQIFLMSKAERCALVYLALRDRNNQSQRYFKSQEDVTLLDDRALRELSHLYTEAFVLTEEERKNLYGVQRS